MAWIRTIQYDWLVSAAALVLVMAWYTHAHYIDESRRLNQLYIDAVLLGDQLRHSSDDLNQMARGYVATGDPIFKKYFEDILATRDGLLPRPNDPFSIHYDLGLAGVPRSFMTSSAAPLLDVLRQAGYSQEEMALLEHSKRQSDVLAIFEKKAMALVDSDGSSKSPEQLKAIQMLYSQDYFLAKVAIMQSIVEAHEQLTRRSKLELHNNHQRAQLLEFFMLFLGLVVTGMLYAKHKGMLTAIEDRLVTDSLFRTVFDNAAVGLAQIDPNGQFLKVNQQFCQILGYEQSELEENAFDFWSLMHSDLTHSHSKSLKMLLSVSDDRTVFENQVSHKDGRMIWCSLKIQIKKNAAGKPVYMIAALTDISEAKANEQSLRKLSLVIEQSPNFIVITDNHAKIEYVNEAFINQTGYELKDIVGKNPRILQSGKTPPETFIEMWNALNQGQSWQGELFSRSKDGKEFVEWVVISPLYQADGSITHFVAVKHDITAKKATQRAIQAYQTNLELMVKQRTHDLARQNVFMDDLIATIPCGVFRINLGNSLASTGSAQSNKPSGYVLDISNANFQKLLGLDAEEIETKQFGIPSRIHPEDQFEFSRHMNECKSNAGVCTWEGRLIIDGSIRWMRIDAISRFMDAEHVCTGVLLDINERMQYRNLLYRSAVDASPDAFVAIDDQGHIIEWSAQAERLFGYASEEIIGKYFANTLIAPSFAGDLGYHLCHYDTNSDSGIIGKRRRITARHRNGQEFPIELQLMALQVDNHWRFTSFIRDITDTVIAEEKTAQLQKLEAIGQLTGGLAHDFNNILGIIIGNIDLIDVRGLSAETRAMLHTAMYAADRGVEITKSLLTVARRSSFTQTVANINELIEEIAPLLRHTAGKRISLSIVASALYDQATIDVSGFNNAVINAALNACDAMPDGGKMMIYSYSTLIESEFAEELDLTPGYYIIIGIDDTGTGMDKDVANQAFDPFFTTKNQGKQGSGLGLAMIWGFCRQSGGTAHIESMLGKGTSLQLILPTVTHPLDKPIKLPCILPAEPMKLTGNVLVVDDEIDLSRIISNWLQSFGCDVTSVARPQTALEFLELKRYDLLLSDMTMPGQMDGLDLAEHASQLYPQMSVILMSGFFDTKNNQSRLKWPLLNKPIEKDMLYMAVKNSLQSLD